MVRELPRRGVLVAFEGIDGAGKTTQARRLEQFLLDHDFDVVFTKEPTQGPWGRQIRESARTGRLPADVELDLFLRDRAEHVTQLVGPSLDRGAIVIIDRYYFSTVAYQGARGIDPMQLLELNQAFAPAPDLLVLLDVDPAVGLARVRSRGDDADLFEEHDALSRSRAIFRTLELPFALHLDGTGTADDIEREIRGALLDGPLLRRLCPDVAAGADACGHVRGSRCPWMDLGADWAPAAPGIGAAINGIASNGRPPAEQVEAIRRLVVGAEG